MSSELTFVNKETNFREILFPQYQKGRKGTADTRTPGFSIKRRTKKNQKNKKLHVIVVRKRLKRQKIHIHSPYITTCKEQKKKK